MTSQKSLKNNVNFNDFKRSLLEPMVFALIAFGVLFLTTTYSVIQYVTAPQNKGGLVDIFQMFMSSRSMFSHGAQYYLFVGMVFCGVLMAYKCFYFLLSKKQVNVYLSLGVTRTTLFINRTLSSVLWLFIASFLPIFITYIVNVVTFGATTLMLNTFLYFSFALFICGIVGLALGSFAMMISGNLIDYTLVLLSLGAIPICCFNAFDYLKYFWLNGFYHTMHTSPYKNVFTPLTFVTSINPDVQAVEPYDLFDTVSKSLLGGKIPETFNVNKYFIIPLLIWLVVSVVLLALAFVLIKARKAEHAHSFGHFPIARGIVSTFAFAMISMCVIQVTGFSQNMSLPVIALVIIGLSLVAFFVIQMIMTRKIKAFVKSLPVLAGFVVILTLVFTTVGTGVFGTYNKVPEVQEVSSISIDFSRGIMNNNIIRDGVDFIESKNPKDIEMILEIFDDMQSSKREKYFVDDVSLMIKYKNGETKLRTFIVSQELYKECTEKVANSDFFDALLEATFIGFNDKGVSKDGNYSFERVENILTGEPMMVAVGSYIDYFDEKVFSADYYDAQGLVYNNTVEAEEKVTDIEGYGTVVSEQAPEHTFNVMQGDELATAIYNDLSKMTFEQIYRNTEKPVGILGVYLQNETVKVDTVVEKYSDDYNYYVVEDKREDKREDVLVVVSYVNIYKEMTETLKYLSDNNISYKDQYKGKVKEILYTDSPLFAEDVLDVYVAKYLEDSIYNSKTLLVRLPNESVWFDTTSLTPNFYKGDGECVTQDYKMYDFIKMLYSDAQHPLRTANSKDFNKILSKTVPSFYTYGDNGRFVYIIYNDGTMTCQYLPEANVGVLN